MTENKKPPGRPPKPMPEPIDADPEDVARVILNTPPKRHEDWRYVREHGDHP